MIKRFICIFISITFLICTFSACSKEEEINVIYPISADPECLDPQIAETAEAILITRNCMEGVVRLGKHGEILPGVADKWKISSDGKTYTFHIREGAKWQKLNSHEDVLGKDFEKTFNYSVTAADCAFGIIRALRPETAAKNAYLLYCIKNAAKVHAGLMSENELGIHVSGDNLVIELERSNPDFIRLLTYPMCMPCNREFFEATGAKYGLEIKYTLCNGPFYVGNWAEKSTLTLYRSDSYVGKNRSAISAMYFNVNTDDEQIVKKFNQEDYNASPVNPQYLSKIDGSSHVKFAKQQNIVGGLVFNCTDLYLANENIRRALIAGLDIKSLDEERISAQGVIPESCRWGGDSYRKTAGTIEKPAVDAITADLLFEAGLEELERSNIDLKVLCTEEQREDVIRLIQSWQKIFGFSITVTSEVVGKDEMAQAVLDGEYQIAIGYFDATDGCTLQFLEKFTTDNEDNICSYSSEDYDAIISKCLYVFEGEQIIEGMKSAERLLITDGVFYPLYTDETCFAYRDEIKCAYPVSNVSDIDFTARVSENDKK
ncbi:MAG: peptide ABC transporter substrate-binding protein [Clostridia bacterium]|nr:peptide ABC transporter substrate-binding protein [Clostridia bacterium]